MYDYLIATDEGFRPSVKESAGKGDVKEEKEKKEEEVKEDEELMKDEEEKKDEEEDESLLGDDESEENDESEEKENEEDDEDALFAVSDEDMEDEPVLEVRSHSAPDP